MKNHSKSSIPNLLGLQKTVENQATYFWWNMQGDTLEPSTYFCWNCKQDFEIKNLLLFGMQKKKKKRKTLEDQAKHLLLLGMQKNTWKPSTYFLLGIQKQHDTLKIQHLTSVGYAKTALQNKALTSSVGYARNTWNPQEPQAIVLPILATITQTNKQTIIQHL